MKNHDEFMREIEHRRMKYDTAKNRRARLITWTAMALAIVLVLPWTLGLFAPRVQAQDLLETVDAPAVEGRDPDQAFRDTQIAFALDLLKGSRDLTEGNLLLSPLSLSLCLSMAANGAAGETLAEMEAVLCGGMDIGTWNEYLYSYVNQLPSTSAVSFHLGNSLWYDTNAGIQPRESYLKTIAAYYDANVYALAFDDEALANMNAWAERETDGMIPQALSRLDQDMYLFNALAFDGKWEEPYESDQVRDGTFTTATGQKQTVSMMSSEEKWYLESDSATGFMKDYEGGDYRFVAILPEEDLTLDQYLDQLTAQDLLKLLDSAKATVVEATMPQFTSTATLELNQVLADLGMATAFSEEAADFSPMAEALGNLYLSRVVHGTYIDVNVQGTKAAAFTFNGFAVQTMAYPVVVLDRPFLYMIVDTQTNLPIFIGTVTQI